MVSKNIEYSSEYYRDIWEKVINKFGLNSPIRDLGDISRSEGLDYLLTKYIKPTNQKRLIINDFGAGNWLYLPSIINWVKKMEDNRRIFITGFDYSLHAMEFALTKFKNILPKKIHIILKDGAIESTVKLLPEKSSDLIISLETLEHVFDDRKIVYQFSRILKSGGFLIISVPNWSPFPLSKNWFDYGGNKILLKKDIAVGHLRRYTKKTLSNLFTNSDLQTITEYKYGFLLSDYYKIILGIIEKLNPSIGCITFKIIHTLLRFENMIGNILKLEGSEGIFMVLQKK